jgi:hypothetical protein
MTFVFNLKLIFWCYARVIPNKVRKLHYYKNKFFQVHEGPSPAEGQFSACLPVAGMTFV